MPRARKFTAVPLTIWSARRWIEKTACTKASAAPAAMPMKRPPTHELVRSAPQAPKNAPISIIPSRPMFTTPLRSENMPPSAANVSGVAYRSVAAVSADHVMTASRCGTAARVAKMPPTIPRMPAALELPPQLPEVDDEEVGPDEEDDEALDDPREVPRELGLEDVRVEVPRRRAVEKRCEEDGGEEDPDRRVAAEQRHGDADERDLRGGLDGREVAAALPPEDVARAGEAREEARDRHREEVVARDVDTAVAGRLGVEPDGADLVADRRPPQDEPVHDEGGERDEEADVQPLEDGAAPEDVELRPRRHLLRHRHRAGFRILQRAAEPDEVARDPERGPVEHDRRDHLVRSDRGAEETGDPSPDGAGERGRDDREQHVRHRRQGREPHAHLEPDDAADDVLALPADVEEAAAEGEGHREPGQDERHRQDERLLQVQRRAEPLGPVHPWEEPVQPRAVEDLLVGPERVLAGRDEDDEPADEERDDGGEDRRDDAARALVEGEPRGDARDCLGRLRRRGRRVGQAGTSPRCPPGIAMPSSSSVTSGGDSRAIPPPE